MARKPVVLISGASGEIGHGLIQEIAERGALDILALDVRPLEPDLARRCAAVRIGDILDRHLLDRVRAEFEISIVFHLAALRTGGSSRRTTSTVRSTSTCCPTSRATMPGAERAAPTARSGKGETRHVR